MKLTNVKISTRLIATFAVLVTLLLALSGFMLSSLYTIKEETGNIADRRVPSIGQLSDIDSAALSLRVGEMKFAYLSEDDASRNEFEQQMNSQVQRMVNELDEYKTSLTSDAQFKQYAELDRTWQATLALHERIASLVRQKQIKQVTEIFRTEGKVLREKMAQVIEDTWNLEEGYTQQALVMTKHQLSVSTVAVWVASILSVLFAILTSTMLVRYILRAFNQAADVSARIASGDLSHPVEGTDVTNEVGKLMSSLESMRTSLAETVASVRENADGVASASEQIAKGNTDLSSRTEQQAAALEETASAMEELSATIQQNTGNAQNADRLAQDASRVANEGGDMVARVVSRMKEINEGSQKVVDIISLIDSIAFQTNLLALNASVEAARAGEQGRGFAVVAAEVRNLAQRSADASREISTLITDSVGNIREGTELASEAGNTMTNVVESVNRLKDIMAEISAASYEQSQGVTQVGTAVTEMDQTTQQNAALVEESAAAAASLRDQAVALVETVKVFRLSSSRTHDNVLKRPAPRSHVPTASSKPTQKTAQKPTPIRSTEQDSSDEWETF